MTAQLNHTISDLLLAEFGDLLSSAEGQRTLVSHSGLSQNLQASISLGVPAGQFVMLLAAFLQSAPLQADGQLLLRSFLIGITDLVRAERRSDWQAQCAEICRALESNPVAPPRQEPSQRKDYSGEFRRKIIQYLSAIPHLANAHTQQTLIECATLDRELQAFLAVGQPPLPFTTLLVSTLLNYGSLSDGRNPLEALLEASKTLIQEQQQAECDTLIEELRTLLQTAEPPVPPRPEPVHQQKTMSSETGTKETPHERFGYHRLPLELHDLIIDVLCTIPQFNAPHVQAALIEKSGFDPQLRWQIQCGGAPADFTRMLVSVLQGYGTLRNGRNALEALLDAAKSFVLEERRAECDSLIRELRLLADAEQTPSQRQPEERRTERDKPIQEVRPSADPKEAQPQRPRTDTPQKTSAGSCERCGQPLGLLDKLLHQTKCKRCR